MSSDPTSPTPTGLHRWFPSSRDHELLDSGAAASSSASVTSCSSGPSPAIWDRGLTESEWRRVSAAEFVPTGRTKGHWEPHQSVPDNWEIRYPLTDAHTLHFSLELTRFKHVGLFPEQAANWRWMADRLVRESAS